MSIDDGVGPDNKTLNTFIDCFMSSLRTHLPMQQQPFSYISFIPTHYPSPILDYSNIIFLNMLGGIYACIYQPFAKRQRKGKEGVQHRYDKTTIYMYDIEKSFESLIKLRTVNI